MGKMNRTYQLTITTLSPLHIGTGDLLLQDYDFVKFRGQSWVVNEDALAAMLYDESQSDFNAMVRGDSLRGLLRDSDYVPDSPLFRYVLSGEPQASSRGAQVQALIKDAWDRPYIPGSSLKGALRTAIASRGWIERGHQFHPSILDSRAKFAAQEMEGKVMYGNDRNGQPVKPGRRPNHDIMRALQISDSAPSDVQLQMLNVQVVTPKGFGSPIDIEAIPQDTTLTARMVLDDFILKQKVDIEQRHELREGVRVRDELGFDKLHRLLLNKLATVVNGFTEARLDEESKRWQNQPGLMRSYYNYLHKEIYPNLAEDEFLIQLGWGGGWDSKTFGAILTENPKYFAQIANNPKYRMMIRQRGQTLTYNEGDRFPKSRRLRIKDNQPVRPLGWIKVKMERVE
jgi:CRISPR-associated protein Csm5